MIGIYNTITINGQEFKRPNNMVIQREDIYAGEYTTCTGDLKADLIGWRYSDATLTFDELTPDELTTLTSFSQPAALTFVDSDGTHTENVIRLGFANTPTRLTLPDGKAVWKDVSLNIRFINAHS